MRATPNKLLRAPASRSLVASLLGMTALFSSAPCPALSAFNQFQVCSNTEPSALIARTVAAIPKFHKQPRHLGFAEAAGRSDATRRNPDPSGKMIGLSYRDAWCGGARHARVISSDPTGGSNAPNGFDSNVVGCVRR